MSKPKYRIKILLAPSGKWYADVQRKNFMVWTNPLISYFDGNTREEAVSNAERALKKYRQSVETNVEYLYYV